MKMNQLLIIVPLLLLCYCSTSKSPQITSICFISGSLENRNDGKLFTHDDGCLGFKKEHFPPSALTVESFEDANLLAAKTGIKWRKVDSSKLNFNFAKHFNNDKELTDNKIVYMAELIESDVDQSLLLSLGSDDGFKLYLNGDSVASEHRGRGSRPFDNMVPLTLTRKKNILLYKVDTSQGEWKLYRKFILNTKQMKTAVASNIELLYLDLPESCIIPDTATSIELKLRDLHQYDRYNTIHFKWKKVDKIDDYISISSYHGNKIPRYIPLPNVYSGKALLEVEVMSESNNTLFKEEIPIFKDSVADEMSRELTSAFDKNNEDPTYQARFKSVKILFKLNEYKDNDQKYSTRMRLHGLVDLYRYHQFGKESYHKFTGPQIFAYRSKRDSTHQIFKAFIPASLDPTNNKPYPIVFRIRYAFVKSKYSPDHFWKYMYRKHYWMTKLIYVGTTSQVVTIEPFGRGLENFKNTEELPLIYDMISQIWNIDSTNISLFTFSDGSNIGLTFLQLDILPFANIGHKAPVYPRDKALLEKFFSFVKQEINPDLNIYIWHGQDDEWVPIQHIRNCVDLLRRLDFNVFFEEIPDAGHFMKGNNIENDFYRMITE